MQLKHTLKTNYIILYPQGRMDIRLAHEFEIATTEILKGKRFHVIVDLIEVEYISSSFIRILLSLKKNLNDLDFRVCNPNSFCKRIIDIVELHKLVDIHPTLQDALVGIA